ncbi:single-pass membrane and coiled-coil domain-containing protein 2 isoform X2 [Talpa occidentalis]|nr:single-pass membrane and coiled-coil domain-containing protein 2 isoform X2 [Talpa occidentalis]
MKTVGKEHQWVKENNDFLQNVGAESRMQKKITNMDHTLERSDDEEAIGSGNPQMKLLHEVETKKQDMLELEAEHDQHLQREQDEQETYHLQPEDPSLKFSENIPKRGQNMFFQLNHWNVHMGKQEKELGADDKDWLEKINSIIQNIDLTENTVKSLLQEVMSLEGQIEKLELHGDLDPDQWTNIEEKIVDIKKQLGEIDCESVQEDAYNEVHELKEKLIARIENFCKDVTQLNTKLGVYPTQEGKTDTLNPEEMGVGKMEALLRPSPSPPLVQSSPPPIWKRALRIFIMLYVLTFTGLSFYILFFDATFIFESLLPAMLGRGRMWELRELITPFLNLEVEDLLPS